MPNPAGESAVHRVTHLVVATTSAAAPFRMPTGFPRANGRPPKHPRVEHRLAQRQRVEEARSLAEKYPTLKALKVALQFVDRQGMTKTTEMKYTANPEHAKAVLVFVCPSPACWGGDFDLTAKLAKAVAKRQTKVAAEIHCLGNHKTSSGQVEPCRSLLRYTLNLAYSAKQRRPPKTATAPASGE